ncbi:MAG TPA: hypothetical protein VF950_13380 [Planctomycetota bacterium]
MKKILLPGLGIGAIVTGLLVVPLVAAALKSGAVEVYQLTPHDKDTVEVNKFMFDTKPEDPDYDRKLMEIYGLPNQNKDVLILIDKSKLVYPAGKNADGSEKRPDLAFYPVEKPPLQAKTVDFFAPLVRIGALTVGALFLVLWYVLKLRRKKAAAAGH